MNSMTLTPVRPPVLNVGTARTSHLGPFRSTSSDGSLRRGIDGVLPNLPAVALNPAVPRSPFAASQWSLVDARPDARPVSDPNAPPPMPETGPVGPIARPAVPMMVDGIALQPIDLADLQPGDIGFDYRKHHRTPKQKLIAMGEHYVNLTRGRQYRGDAGVLHGFIVLQSFPTLGKLRIVDASDGQGAFGVGMMDLHFTTPRAKDSYYVFYRLRDPRLQDRMAQIARNWGEYFVTNFSSARALTSPFAPTAVTPLVKRQLLHLSQHALEAKPMPALHGDGYYYVMCTEFVSIVASTALMSLYADDHPEVKLGDPQTLAALGNGPAGQIFNRNPHSIVPSALAGALGHASVAQPVGYCYGPEKP